MTKDYVKAASALAKVAGRLQELEEEIEAANRALAGCGDGRRVEAVEHAVRPRGSDIFYGHPHLLAELVVPDPHHMSRPLWGPDFSLVKQGRADPPPVAAKGAAA